MGRKSAKTPQEWLEIEKEIVKGELSRRAIADKWGLSETALRKRFGAQEKEIKRLANQLVTTEQEILALPISSQMHVRTLADELKAISSHMASAAKYGAMTAHRLHAMAHMNTDKLDDAATVEENLEPLKFIKALTGTGNDAMAPALALINANKEQVSRLGEPEKSKPKTLADYYGETKHE